MEFHTGDIVGAFRLGERIGGRFGEVRRATRTAGGADTLVLKLAGDAEQAAQLAREAQVAAAVGPHPRLVQPLETHLSGKPAYLVLPHYPGGSLRSKLSAGGHYPPARAAEIVADVLDGLAALHAAGFAHGDLKPENVLLDADGRAAVADFGLAHASGGAPTDGRAAGTWHYMSPEQKSGGAADPSSDVFAAGMILFELMTGRRPDGPIEEMGSAVMPRWARTVTDAACAPPEERPADGGELRELLTSLFNLGDRAAPAAAPANRPAAPAGPAPNPPGAFPTARPMVAIRRRELTNPDAPPPMKLSRRPAGTRVGRYVLDRHLGGSRFAETWKALRDDGAPVVVKFFSDPQYVNNLRHDRRPVMAVRHRNLSAMLERNLNCESPYAIMEFADGGPLRDRLTGGRMAPEVAGRILADVLAGLAAAHRVNIAHRNLKPENVMVSADGRAVVTDLGLGQAVEETTCQMCMSGIDWSEFAGNWRYLAPEQEAGETGTAASDVFAAGLMFYEMLIGCLPPAVLRETTLADLPLRTRSLLVKALGPLASRYQNAGEFLAALEAAGMAGSAAEAPVRK